MPTRSRLLRLCSLILIVSGCLLLFSAGLASPLSATTGLMSAAAEAVSPQPSDDPGIELPPLPANWWVNFIAAAIGVLIAYGVYYLRLRAVARQKALLETEVALRTAELKLLNEELDREIHRRADFNRALVHELKTPLTAMLASAELFVDDLAGDPRQELAKNIHRAAQNLDRRTDELLDVAKGEVGMLTVAPSPGDARPLLIGMADNLKAAAARKHQTLIVDVPADLPKVRLDEDRLRQVLYNYLTNAVKYTPKGGEITLKAYAVQGELRVEVKDSGPGISGEAQKRLFEPYYRVPQSGGEKLSGLGLGLALSKMIIELHGGRVWVESEPGHGATFGLALPTAADRGNV
ncbi:HAMP domain-containing sensor histidine kinase [Dehalogenimonas sp. 4OHTPN]|uniref:histidine kinase n=1 Tax=Dehalogenimonas sp. 4OHTPN TaxID=3166643 RepID=A0AAU8G6W8_9CHLR